MEFISTPLKGLLIIKPRVFRDERGFFLETYNERVFREHGITETFVQDNMSRSGKRTLRGLHYQIPPHSQGKLVRALEGEVFDVAVDIHPGSSTFGRWFGYILSADNHHALYIPPGFAHGFIVLSETALFSYKCTALYAPSAERGILWSDPKIGIEWPLQPDLNLMSDKDKKYPTLEKAAVGYYF